MPGSLYAIIAGLAAVIGGWLTLSVSRGRMAELGALGAGLLTGGALLSMLPQALHGTGGGPAFVALGYFSMLALRRLWPQVPAAEEPSGAGSAAAAAVGLWLHSLVDGAALGIAQQTDTRLGITTFMAVTMHKLPEGFSLAALVLGATESTGMALLAAAGLGAATVVGAWIPVLWMKLGSASGGALMGLAAGSFLYIGATDLLPGLARRGRYETWLILLGGAIVYALTRGIPHVH